MTIYLVIMISLYYYANLSVMYLSNPYRPDVYDKHWSSKHLHKPIVLRKVPYIWKVNVNDIIYRISFCQCRYSQKARLTFDKWIHLPNSEL